MANIEKRTFKGTMSQAYGKPLDSPIDFSGSYDAYLDKESIHPSQLPTDEDWVNWVNNRTLAAARQKAMNAALENAGIEKPDAATDEDLQFKTVYNMLIKARRPDGSLKHTAETATAAANAAIGRE